MGNNWLANALQSGILLVSCNLPLFITWAHVDTLLSVALKISSLISVVILIILNGRKLLTPNVSKTEI